jgi:hypothetical protein
LAHILHPPAFFGGSLTDGKVFKTDAEKANLFRSVLGETFTNCGLSSDFDTTIYNYVEDYAAKLDYSDDQYAKVTFVEMIEVINSLRIDSSPGEDGIHYRFLKNFQIS